MDNTPSFNIVYNSKKIFSEIFYLKYVSILFWKYLDSKYLS